MWQQHFDRHETISGISRKIDETEASFSKDAVYLVTSQILRNRGLDFNGKDLILLAPAGPESRPSRARKSVAPTRPPALVITCSERGARRLETPRR